MKRENVLVFAAHPGQEILGCGGFLCLKANSGAQIRIIIVSDSAQGMPAEESIYDRSKECLAGLKLLGVAPEYVTFWDYRDKEVPLSGPIIEKIRLTVGDFKPQVIVLPHPKESHSDHQRVTRAILKALESRWRGTLQFFETIEPAWPVDHHIDISSVIEKKKAAMQMHVSQLSQFDYVHSLQLLAALRGSRQNMQYAEAFLIYEWDSSPQLFFDNQPLISVILRANDMSLAQNALTSLCGQYYEHFEVILVWHGQDSPDLSDFHILDIRVVQGESGRSRNLNLGLAAARGEFISILDQDDYLYPQHFAELLPNINGVPFDIAFSGCKLVACERMDDDTIKPLRVIGLLKDEKSPSQILFGNTIPVHALLLKTSVTLNLRFDEDFHAYEDWDFLTRCVLTNARFIFVDEFTCEYRLYESAFTMLPEISDPLQDHQALRDALAKSHSARGYIQWSERIYAKITKQLDGAQFSKLAGYVNRQEASRRVLQATIRTLNASIELLQARYDQAEDSLRMLDNALRFLDIGDARGNTVELLLAKVLPTRSLFSIVLPVFNTEPALLLQTLQSVRSQSYTGWELCIVDDGSSRGETLDVLASIARDPSLAARTQVILTGRRNGISSASNLAISSTTAPYLVFLDHDDLLRSDALLQAALRLQKTDYKLIYSDSYTIDHNGRVLDAYRKPGWSPETLLHMNYINHLTIVAREAMGGIGGLESTFDGAQDWRMLLRLLENGLSSKDVCHIREFLYGWRATYSSVAYDAGVKPETLNSAVAALHAHFELTAHEVVVQGNPVGAGFVASWMLRQEPLDVVIIAHKNAKSLQRCLDGFRNTEYSVDDIHLTVIGHRCSQEVREFLAKAEMSQPICVLYDDAPFNKSRLTNLGIASGKSPFVLCLGDGIEIKSGNWLRSMMRFMHFPAVAVVGAVLLDNDDNVLHHGIHTSSESIGKNVTNYGNKLELALSRNVAAVAGDCILFRREVWERVAGFDEALTEFFGDVDFCLSARQADSRVVQAFEAQLIHHAVTNTGNLLDDEEKQILQIREASYMRKKWGHLLEDFFHSEYLIQYSTTKILHV